MSKEVISVIGVFVIVAGVLLFQATRSGTSLVLLPSQLYAEEKVRSLARVRVAGRVSEPIEYQVEPAALLRFQIHNPGTSVGEPPVTVIYHGLRPDMFAAGRDVIIDGEFKNGVLLASNLLTQCPSKYEPPSPEKKFGIGTQKSFL